MDGMGWGGVAYPCAVNGIAKSIEGGARVDGVRVLLLRAAHSCNTRLTSTAVSGASDCSALLW